MKPLLVYMHMGLGDAIIANGLVRHLAKERDVMFLCKLHNHPSVSWMFSDSNVLTVAVAGDEGAENFIAERGDKVEVMRLTGSGSGFDRQFYEAAGVPFEERWSGFMVMHYPAQHRVPPYPFCFIHDDGPRSYFIPDPPSSDLPIVRAVYDPKTPNIFAWCDMLTSAAEIRCIPSSFSVLADSGPDIVNQKLYLHASARPNCEMPTYRKNWTLL